MGFPNRIQTLFGFLDTRSEPNIITNVTIMGTSVATKGFAVLCAFLFCWTSPSLQKDKHSLYYIYTALSKPVEQPGIHQFTAMGLLDDRQIDYYNSQEHRKIPKQRWMKEKMQEDYWEKGTQSRKSKEQWFNVNVDILIKRMRHNESDVHVLQWRHGCEIEKQGDEVRFSRGIDEYSYDGDNFLSFDDKESQWVAPVEAALQTKRKWDNVPILNQYTKGYLEKECVDWLNKFREYGDEDLRKSSPPKVYLLAKKSIKDKPKLKLTCLATGFYPKDVMLTLRKYRTPLPEYDIESTGIRPNHDETFQLEKSVFIQENEKAEYDCFVFHKTLSEPIIVRWDGKCINCNKGSTPTIQVGVVIGVLIAVLIAILLVAALLYLYKTKRLVIPWRNTNGAAQRNDVAQNLLSGDNYSNGHAQTAANGHAQTAAKGHAQTAANGHAQTAANGHAQTAANGHAQTAANGVIPWRNTNGAEQRDDVAQNLLSGDNYSNGHAQTAANGHAQTAAKGHAQTAANGHAQTAANGHAQTAANGHAQTAANGGNSGMEANV